MPFWGLLRTDRERALYVHQSDRGSESLILVTTMGFSVSVAEGSGSMIIAGNGPELRTIERLAGAFEKSHLGSVVGRSKGISMKTRLP